MATDEEAHHARAQYSDFLRDTGAHAIGVDKIDSAEDETFAVIAYYETQPTQPLPDSLEIEEEGNKKTVPLTTMITPRATLE